MSIPAVPGGLIAPRLEYGPPGIAAALTHGIRVSRSGNTATAGDWAVALTATGITEEVVDVDNSHYIGSLTVPADADLTAGYEVVWITPDDDEAVEALDFTDVDDERLLIDPDDVAPHVLLRTTVMGTVTGTFSADTIPTRAQVEALIASAAGDLAARVGTGISEQWITEAQRLVAIKAAADVERSLFPNQLDTDQSSYRQLIAEYLSGVEALTQSARRPGALRLT